MIFSRALQVEFECSHNSDGEGAYTVFNVIQPLLINYKPANEIMIQTFAILWTDSPDTRLIAMIEQALIIGALPPVKLLHASKGELSIIYNKKLKGRDFTRFRDAWTDIALGVWYDEWTAEFIKEDSAIITWDKGRLLRAFAPAILDKHDLGSKPFTGDMFLHHEEWMPDKIFGGNDCTEPVEQVPEFIDWDPLFEAGIPYPKMPPNNT
ncbi:hypothetical protein AO066_05215 [Pseudomonas fluorescens]|nr:hypothetical protein AO066_05215 [Pseudomonas fluorescens]RMP73592.1 hypothetical protein ALQ17_04466 [Pseudomonas fluorescens]